LKLLILHDIIKQQKNWGKYKMETNLKKLINTYSVLKYLSLGKQTNFYEHLCTNRDNLYITNLSQNTLVNIDTILQESKEFIKYSGNLISNKNLTDRQFTPILNAFVNGEMPEKNFLSEEDQEKLDKFKLATLHTASISLSLETKNKQFNRIEQLQNAITYLTPAKDEDTHSINNY
jgi:hypothetical protein